MSGPAEDPPGNWEDSVTFTIPESRKRLGLWIFAIIGGVQVLLVLGLWWQVGRFPWVVVLAMSVPMMGGFGIVWCLNRFVYDPQKLKLVIGKEGIYAPRMAESLIPWSEIESMAIRPYYAGPWGSGLVLTLQVPDAQRFGPRGTNIVRRLSQWRFGSDLLVPVSGLNRPVEDIADTIERFASASLVTLSRRGV
jgi:hypothetical protein